MTPVRDLRSRLLEAAEAILEESGAREFSVRAVTSRAGANVASVSTVFGGRTALLDELLSRRLADLGVERAHRLRGVHDRGGDLSEVVSAFLQPLAAVGTREADLLAHLLALLAEPAGGGRRPVQVLLDDPVVPLFQAEIRRVLPDLPPAAATERVALAVGAVYAAVAGTQHGTRAVTPELIAFVTAGLRGSPN